MDGYRLTRRPGLRSNGTNVVGLLISLVGTLLLFLHTTSEYHAAIQDIGSIAVAYLGLVLFGVSVSLMGITLSMRVTPDQR